MDELRTGVDQNGDRFGWREGPYLGDSRHPRAGEAKHEGMYGKAEIKLEREELRIRMEAEKRLGERAELERSLEELRDRRVSLLSRPGRFKTGSKVLYGVSGFFLLGSAVTLTVDLAGDPAASLMPIGGALGIGGVLGAIIATVLILEQPDMEEADSAIRDLQQKLQDS